VVKNSPGSGGGGIKMRQSGHSGVSPAIKSATLKGREGDGPRAAIVGKLWGLVGGETAEGSAEGVHFLGSMESKAVTFSFDGHTAEKPQLDTDR